jgi:RHS repeat-associated protein
VGKASVGLFRPVLALMRRPTVGLARAGARGRGALTARVGSVRDAIGGLRRGGAVPADARALRADPVDVATGEVVLSQTDVRLEGMPPLLLTRTHVSSYRVGRWFGTSWASTLDQRLEVDKAGVCYAAADGMLLAYPPPAPGAQAMPERGPRLPLTCVGSGEYTIDVQGEILWFARRPGLPEWVLPLVALTDRNGNRTELEYDPDGSLSEVRHSGGHRIAVETAGGRIVALRSVDEVGSPLVRYRYDDAGRLTGVINSSGQELRFSYDTVGRLTGWRDRNGGEYRYFYDDEGRCVRTRGSGGFLNAEFAYEDGATTHADSLGHRTRFELNDLGQIVEEIDPLGNRVRTTWDRYDRLISRTDPLGHTIGYTYDEVGDLLSVTLPDDGRIRIEYNAMRLPARIVGADGAEWRQEFDERGNRTAVTDPLGGTTTYAYDHRGHLRAVTDGVGRTHRFETDAAGLPVAIINSLGAEVRCTRDEFGRVSEVTDPVGGVTRLGWTIEGRPAWRTRDGGAVEQWRYDGEGNVVEYVDAAGRASRVEYGPFDRPVAEIGPDGARLEITYDTELRPTAVTDPVGLTWRYEYDAVGALVREVDFDGRVLTYVHDAAGRPIEITNGCGETTRYVRDAKGLIIEARTGESVSTFTRDAAGRLVRAIEQPGAGDLPVVDLRLERDRLGRVVAETCNGRTVTSTYDPLGRRVERRTPSAASVWEYDTADRPLALHVAGTTIRFAHDAAGREVERLIGPDVRIAHSWEADGRPATRTIGGRRQSFSYTPDGMVTAAGDRRFELDAADRVTAVHGPEEGYEYDAAGRILAADWPAPPGDSPYAGAAGERAYDGARLRRAGVVRYEHDAQGRVVRRQRGSLAWSYEWDGDDRLVAAVTPGGERWRYVYDPLGRRIAKQRLTGDGAVAEQVEFVWDGPVIAEEIRSQQTTVWDWEPGMWRPVCQTELSDGRGEPYLILAGVDGAPEELIDTAGRTVWRSRATLWGATLDGELRCPLRLPGQYHDAETGLHYNVARYYEPSAGRYLSPDPLGLWPAPDPYAYPQNPTAYGDPLGLAPYSTQPDVMHVSNVDPEDAYNKIFRYPGTRQLVVGGGTAPGFPKTSGILLNIRSEDLPHVVADIAHAPFKNASFDRVYFECIPYHAVSGENLGALAETARILRPGGWALLRTGGAAPKEEILGELNRLGFHDFIRFGDHGFTVMATR